VLIEIKTKQEE